ncbi:hypothetical protein NCS13_1_0286 [Neochlamydia sp. S13]|nr:hypothetical protein NCS13_1_0286 [Neochlamydia sp. S13]
MGKLSIDVDEIGCILFSWVVITFQHFYFLKQYKKIKEASQTNSYPYQGKTTRR